MKVYIMVGCPYSGKSTYAKELSEESGAVIISSDRVRAQLFGDAECQKEPAKVFQVVRQKMHEQLKAGKDVIIDSTAMTRKARRPFMEELKQYKDIDITAIVCAVCLEELKIRQKKRPRFVPWAVIMKQLKQFEFPLYGEGFDDIWIVGIDSAPRFLNKDLVRALDIPHDTKWHKESIGDHMLKSYSHSVYAHYPWVVSRAAQYHDIGKIYTKEFKDRKGEKTEDAHFFGHAGVGAYLYAAERWQQEEDTIEVCQLISYHMIWAYMDQKGLDKIHRLMGDELWKKLEQLHDCDEHGRDSDLEAIY